VLAVEGAFAKIAFAGWQREGTESALYGRQGKRIVLASLDEAAMARLEAVGSVEDADTGQTWTEMRLEAWVPATGFLRDVKPLWDYAARMYQDNCTLCHVLPRPDSYTVNAWVGHFNAMKRLTPLTEQEAGTLLTYLQTKARDGVR
jgi:trimethylamine-N-oxide reductase cytochrome c-type subunit TorC